ncbi:MAG: hypothetical protein ACREMN_01195 [Gemmatimonadales bacterium]
MSPASRQDVLAEIERLFAASERTTALKTVNLIMGKPGEREEMQLVLVEQSGGNLEQLRGLVDSAKRRPSPPRAAPPVTDAASAQYAQATATAQLIGAQRGAGQDATVAVGSSKEYLPIRWLFYVAIGAIPVITLGGAIPFAISASGIAGVSRIMNDARQPLGTRLLFSTGITLACWVALFGLVGAVSAL